MYIYGRLVIKNTVGIINIPLIPPSNIERLLAKFLN